MATRPDSLTAVPRLEAGDGDTVFFDNRRVMHARRAFADPARHLRICNLSRDDFHQRPRLAAARLGFDAGARQVLPAGVSG